MGKLTDQLRIMAVARRFTRAATPSCFALMKEFLHREAKWGQRLGLTDELPFVDLASRIDPALQCSESDLAAVTTVATSSAEVRCFRNMLVWDRLLDTAPDRLSATDLPEPYEPLLRLFLRGGFFTREHGIFVQVNYRLTSDARYFLQPDLPPPLISLDEVYLDELDRNGLPNFPPEG